MDRAALARRIPAWTVGAAANVSGQVRLKALERVMTHVREGSADWQSLAAIPAVMAYNYFNRKIRVLSNEMDGFSNDFLNIVKRHFFKG